MKSNLFWVYVLYSKKDKKLYIGYTQDLNKRLKEHTSGQVTSTKQRRPFKLVYIEACTNQKDALRRENYFKKSGGRVFLSKRLKEFFLEENNS
jgi:putative endonuclease